MVIKTETESKLLQASKKYDQALTNQKLDSLNEVVDQNIVIHADGITLKQDVKGLQAVQQYWQKYFDTYEFKHEVIAGAVNKEDKVAFSFWADVDVKVKDPSQLVKGDKISDEDTKPLTTLGVFKHEFGSDGKIKETWFLRQLSNDESARKLKQKPDFAKLAIDHKKYQGSEEKPSEERAQKMQTASEKYSKIWESGNPAAADEIMVDDVREVDLLYGQEVKGREQFKKMIQEVFKNWEQHGAGSGTIAVSAGNKAFLHWSCSGKEKSTGKEVPSVYGMTVLNFNNEAKITEVFTLRQPFASEADKMLSEQ
jgi:ketosteroid isomerase-like protein